MTRPTPRKKTALELAEERRLAALTPDERERLEAARKKLRERAERSLRRSTTAYPNETGQEPVRVKLDNLARDERERLAAMEPAERQALARARRKMRRFPIMTPRPQVDPEQVARDAEDLL